MSTRAAPVLHLQCWGTASQSILVWNGIFNWRWVKWATSLNNHFVPCAVCYASTRVAAVMIPAQYTCPSSWTREYYGYLMAQYYGYHRTTFEYVDQSSQSIPGSVGNTNGDVFHHVEVKCTGIPCPPYDTQKEVTCVVCTK